MARSDRSRPSADRRPRSSEPPLTLSTGRLEGRAASEAAARRNRHNPLRDEYPSRRDDPRPSRFSDDIADNPRSRRRSPSSQDRGARRSSNSRRDADSRARAPRCSGGTRTAPRRRLDLRTAAFGALAIALAAIFVMALAHVGPFSRPQQQDPAKNLGVIGLAAVSNNATGLFQNAATQISFALPVEPELDELPPHTPTAQEILALSDQKAPFAFTLNSDDSTTAPVLSDRSLVALNNALMFYEVRDYAASYLMLDLTTGRGIAGNLDQTIYGASSFKGPFCTYVVQRELPNDIESASSSRTTEIENAIIYSDNASYGQLRRDFGNDGIKEWLSEAGVDAALADDTMFPRYTGRQAALMWLKIYDYLKNTDTSAAQWLSDTFEKTEVSFLRNGALGTSSAGHTDYLPEEGSGSEESFEETELAADAADGTEPADDELLAVTVAKDGEEAVEPAPEVASLGSSITVRNKAGWIAGEDDDAICDAGIVTINGHDYLMVIMTSAADSAEGEQAFAHLARTLFEVRTDLV